MVSVGWLMRDRAIQVTLVVGLLTTMILQGCVGLTTEGEREIGQEAANEVEQTMGLTDNPKVVGYVKAIGQRLAAESPRQDVSYHFHVVEMKEPNAFALPGGYIYISRGLLPLANSEDELAGVIGHEIGHVAARHSVKRMTAARAATPFAIAGGITAMATGIVSQRLGDAVMSATGVTVGAFLAPYSRGQEREADELGVDMAARAGWDPKAMSSFLRTLEREVELQSGGPRQPSFLDSHPATPQRVADTAAHAKKVTRASPRSIAPDSVAFLRKLEGLIVGVNPAEGVFDDTRFLHPDLGFTVHFPEGWQTVNAKQYAAAAQPEGSAFALIQLAGRGDDPLDAPRALEKQSGEKVMDRVEKIQVGNLPAARLLADLRTPQGRATAEITWIAYRGNIYQIMGVSPRDKFESYRKTLGKIPQSFRPLTSEERRGIKVSKLQVVQARDGETLENLVARTGSSWKSEEVAVSNGLKNNDRLKKGQLVKVAIPEPY